MKIFIAITAMIALIAGLIILSSRDKTVERPTEEPGGQVDVGSGTTLEFANTATDSPGDSNQMHPIGGGAGDGVMKSEVPEGFEIPKQIVISDELNGEDVSASTANPGSQAANIRSVSRESSTKIGQTFSGGAGSDALGISPDSYEFSAPESGTGAFDNSSPLYAPEYGSLPASGIAPEESLPNHPVHPPPESPDDTPLLIPE